MSMKTAKLIRKRLCIAVDEAQYIGKLFTLRCACSVIDYRSPQNVVGTKKLLAVRIFSLTLTCSSSSLSQMSQLTFVVKILEP